MSGKIKTRTEIPSVKSKIGKESDCYKTLKRVK